MSFIFNDDDEIFSEIYFCGPYEWNRNSDCYKNAPYIEFFHSKHGDDIPEFWWIFKIVMFLLCLWGCCVCVYKKCVPNTKNEDIDLKLAKNFKTNVDEGY